MKFSMDQIALHIPLKNREHAFSLLKLLGIIPSVEDEVLAEGTVVGQPTVNKALLSYNYTALENAREFEVLTYTVGDNWMDTELNPAVSHFGMHVAEEELALWREKLAPFAKVVQEVNTLRHTNPEIAGKRSYHYVIFGTRGLIGVDLKFIVRKVLE